MKTYKLLAATLVVAFGIAPALPSFAQLTPTAPTRTPDVIFVPTPQPVVDAMLKLAKVKSGEMVYDLGCGDGRAVITAARDFGARGIGVDIDPERIQESTANATAAGVTERVQIKQADLFEMQFSDADVLFLYLLPALNVRLRPRILDELRPGTRVVSHAFSMGDWEPDEQTTVDGKTVYFWMVPAKIAGNWKVTLPGGEEATLSLTQEYQKVKGALKTSKQTLPIGNARIEGAKLSFSFGNGAEARRANAEVSGERLSGTLQRQAGEAEPWTGSLAQRL